MGKGYYVEIVETLRKKVFIEGADTKVEAEQRAMENWHKGEYILDEENFAGVKFIGTEI